jgi:PAS domain S-box-containing protein
MSAKSSLRGSAFLRYGLAVLLAFAALLLHIGLIVLLRAHEDVGNYQFFLVAVILSAVWAGRFCGLLTLGLSVVLRLYFFIPPEYSLTLHDPASVVRLILFTGLGFVIALVGGSLYESEERFSTALTSIGDAVIATDEKRAVNFMNPVAESLSGWTAGGARGRDIEEVVRLVDERTESGLEPPIAAALQRREVIRLPEDTSLVSRDGTSVAIADSAAPIHGGSGQPRGAIMVFRDVSEQRNARKALRDSEARYRFLADALPEFIFTATAAGQCDYFNRRWYEYTGLTTEQSYGHGWTSALHPDDATGVLSQWTASIESVKGFEAECRLAARDGSYRAFLMRGLPMSDETGEIQRLFGVFTDIEDLKRHERQLRLAQKLEALGRLAGGVAHDFNNLLTVITGFGTMLRDAAAQGDTQRVQADQICWAAEQAAALTRQLLTFSRRQAFRPAVQNVNELVREAGQMLRRLIGEDIAVETRLDPQLMSTRIDHDQMMQVLMNLAVNARDAMPEGGRLIVETANVNLSQEYPAGPASVPPGPYIILTVSDTGEGMDAETQAHAFEPFFTTKGPGKGTGLGLSTVYGVVMQSGGYVGLYSEPGNGTSVKIYLPAVQESLDPEQPPPAAAGADAGGTETILVLEDQDHVRKLIAVLLTQQGYTVLQSGKPEEALRLCELHAGPIHLLLTDMVMPGMSGRQAAAEAIKHRPALKVVYMSGYSDEMIRHHAEPEFAGDFIQKPFAAEVLLQKIRQALDDPQRPETA